MTSYIVHIEPRADPLKVIDNFTQYTLRIDGDKALEILTRELREIHPLMTGTVIEA